MYTQTVAVLRGGPSEEYEISMKTGAGVLTALADSKYHVKDITITKGGVWLLNGYEKRPEDALFDVDVVFIALHGAYGEDGTVQRTLERLRIPYTGSAPYASAIAMNKRIAKEHLKDAGIKMARHMQLTKDGVTDHVKTADSIHELFGTQYVVKPVAGGSSIGTQIARSAHELANALATTLATHEVVLVEELIEGKEATVGVLENYRNERQYVMPAVEIIPPTASDFFDAEVKYSGDITEICPGRFTKKQKLQLTEAAKKIHTILDLRHYSRSDFIVSGDDIYFLEVNTLPGLTAESLFPKSIDAVGGTYKELIEHLIHQAGAAHYA